VRSVLHDTRTRVLLAVMRQQRPTVRSVAGEVGISVMTAHKHLCMLAADDLVAWDAGRKATLHALVREVTLDAR
jgi:predicted ArsR family transcriptional regulator